MKSECTIQPCNEMEPTTEITIYFDGSCGMCSKLTCYARRLLARRNVRFIPLQTPGIAEQFGLNPGEIPDEMKLQTDAGHYLGGVDALLHLAKMIGWLFPLRAIAILPGGKTVLRTGYRWIAANRHRISKTCRLKSPMIDPKKEVFSTFNSVYTEMTEIID